MKYKIKNNKGYLRWENWQDFFNKIDSNINIDKKNEFVILTIHYNNANNIINLIETIKKDVDYDKYDLLIIENSTKEEEKNKLSEYIKEDENINIYKILPVNNLGSAGGYAIGLEYIFSKNEYKYIYIIEDDVILLNENTFSEMRKQVTEKNLVYINHHVAWIHSWPVQLGLYPVSFLKKVGVTDPTYFTRSEDIDLLQRIDNISENENYTYSIIDKNYFHPYGKKGNGQPRWIYFVIRNALKTTSKWFTKQHLSFYVNVFLYIWYGISKIFIEKSIGVFMGVILSIIDFIKGVNTLEGNIDKITFFRKYSSNCNLKIENLEVDLATLNNLCEGYYLIYDLLLCKEDRENIKYSKKLKNFFIKGCLIGGFNSPIYPLFILSKNIISIDEYDNENGKYFISILNNNKNNYIQVFISLLIATIVFILLFPIILLKGLFIYFIKYF